MPGFTAGKASSGVVRCPVLGRGVRTRTGRPQCWYDRYWMVIRSMRLAVVLGFVALLSTSGIAAQDRPLPDQQTFLKEARKHLQRDTSVQRTYMYVETRRETKLDKDGRVEEETVKVVESYPGLPGQPRWERVISENGKPVPTDELAGQDRDRAQKATAMARRMETEPAKERTRQERDWEKLRNERDEAVADIYTVFDIKMAGRERIEGHDTIAFQLTPRPDSKPKTREGDMMKHFTVRAWISETDYELVRLEADAIDNLSFGFGIFAKLHKGAKLSFLRRKINGEVWLPAVASYSGSARVGLLWTLRRTGTSEYSGYKKFSVDTSSSFQSPQ